MRNYTIFLHQTQYEPKTKENKSDIAIAQNKLDEATTKSFLKEIEPHIKKKELKVLPNEDLQRKDWRPSVRLEVADKLEDGFPDLMRTNKLVAVIDADYVEPK